VFFEFVKFSTFHSTTIISIDEASYKCKCRTKKINNNVFGLKLDLLFGFLDLLDGWGDFLLWLQDGDNIWVLFFWTVHAGLVMRFQNLHFNTNDTLSQENVSNSGVNVRFDWVTGMDHHTVNEFHTLRSLSSDFTGNNNFATSGTLFHDESKDTVGGSSDSETSEKLVSERFGLSDSGHTSVGNSFDVEIDLALFVAPSFVDDGGQFSNSSSFFSQNLTWSGGDDDDFAGLGFSDDQARVSVFSEFSGEKFVHFGFEETISDEEMFLGDWSASLLGFSHVDFFVRSVSST